MDRWDPSGSDRFVLYPVRLGTVRTSWWIRYDERLWVWHAHDVLWVWHDAFWNLLHVSNSTGSIDPHRAGHRLVGKATDDQSLIHIRLEPKIQYKTAPQILRRCFVSTGLLNLIDLDLLILVDKLPWIVWFLIDFMLQSIWKWNVMQGIYFQANKRPV